jgi:hypothetical protein
VHCRALFIYRANQAVARGGARCASNVLYHCARMLPAAPRRQLSAVPRPLPTAALVVRCGYLAVVPRPMPAAPLVAFRRYLIVVSSSLPRRRDVVEAGEDQLCWCSAEKREFYPHPAINCPGAPRSMPVAPLGVFLRYLIVVPRFPAAAPRRCRSKRRSHLLMFSGKEKHYILPVCCVELSGRASSSVLPAAARR